MNICIPVEQDQGLQSQVCAHFGSAPAFLIVATDSGDCRAIDNKNQHHGHERDLKAEESEAAAHSALPLTVPRSR